MGILNFIANLFTPANKLIETLDVSGNKKKELQNVLADIQAKANEHLIELEKAALDAQTRRIEAEAKSENFLTANWRPAASLTLVVAIILSSYGIGHPSDQLYSLAEIIIGAHVGGRSLEKIAKVGGLGSIVKGIK